MGWEYLRRGLGIPDRDDHCADSAVDLFCNGMLDLGDGRPIIVGGSEDVCSSLRRLPREASLTRRRKSFNQVESMADGDGIHGDETLATALSWLLRLGKKRKTPSPTPTATPVPRRTAPAPDDDEAGTLSIRRWSFIRIGHRLEACPTRLLGPRLSIRRCICCQMARFFARETRQAPTCLRLPPKHGPSTTPGPFIQESKRWNIGPAAH